MKVLIVVSCFLALASAGLIYPQHLPVIGPNGVPLEPPANVAARAQHAAAVAAAQARNGDLIGRSAAAYITAGPQHIPVIGPNGVPLEPPANVAARAQHAAAVAAAQARNGDALISSINLAGAPLALTAAPGLYAATVIGPNGVPVEPLENQIARAQNAAAHIAAKARNGDIAILGRKRRSVYLGPQHIPVIGPNGVPLEPAENVAARIAHAAAHARAAGRSGALVLAPGYAVIPESRTYPALAPDGQPIETPEVQILKANHLAAHAEARARNGAAPLFLAQQLYAGPLAVVAPNGVPIDTPEVQAARAAHFAAKAAALAIVPH